MDTQKPPLILDAALAYAGRGWPIFPLLGKIPDGRLAPHGVKDATTNPDTIRDWWRQNANANIGLAAGEASGFLVLDVDPRHGGDESLATLEKAHGQLPATMMCLTGGGGEHYYFRHVGGLKNRNGHIGAGLDIKTTGGYVVAPPSLHESGHRYAWSVDGHPDEVPLADAPAWLIGLARGDASHDGLHPGDPRPARSGDHWEQIAAGIPDGRRNDSLTSVAGLLFRKSIPRPLVLPIVAGLNAVLCKPPLDEGDVDRIVASVGRYDRGAGVRAQWPDPLAEAAFHGLAGEVVRAIEPASEADIAALLFSFLVAFGNCVGRGPYYCVEGDKHRANLFALIVGATSKARKGTSWGRIRDLFEQIDPAWVRDHTAGGLATGQGLIERVKDVAPDPNAPTHPAPVDKRVAFVESEGASILKRSAEGSSILSPVLRQAWDGTTLHNLTKADPSKASDAHISVLVHITQSDLCSLLESTEAGNGFANRFIFVCAKRSKELSRGGNAMLDPVTMAQLAAEIREAALSAKDRGEVTWSDDGGKLWDEVYGELSEGGTGMVGAITGRAEAQVVRLAMIYALLDQSQYMERPHLEAALAVWRYAEASVECIFGAASGDPLAERVLAAIRDAGASGITRTDLQQRFARHGQGAALAAVLERLEASRVISRQERDTGGRPLTIYRMPAAPPGT